MIYELQEEFFSVISGELEKTIDEDQIHLFEIAEIKFVFSVVIPSYAFYGIDPFQIFERAQKGILQDIEKILRLDQSAIGDPQIFQHFHNASKSSENQDAQTMLLALQKPPKGLTSLQKIKYKIAGLISGITEMLNYKLSAPDIEKLFDALSKDLDNPDLKLVETDDINTDNESIAKRISRERKFWQRYLKIDK